MLYTPRHNLITLKLDSVFFNPNQLIKESTSPDELAEWILWARVQIVRLIVNILEFFDSFQICKILKIISNFWEPVSHASRFIRVGRVTPSTPELLLIKNVALPVPVLRTFQCIFGSQIFCAGSSF